MKTYVIYKARNIINNKVYIGKTYNFKKRKREHIYDLKRSSSYFHRAILKYGEENFEWTILENNLSKEDANEKEKFYIKYYNSYVHAENSNGYNLSFGGDGGSHGHRKVILLDLNNNFVKEFDTIKDADDFVGSRIKCCLKGQNKRVKNYIALYKEEYDINKDYTYKKKNNSKSKGIIQLDLKGNFINKFETINEASKNTKTNRTSIISVANKKYHSANGYLWVYEKEYNKNNRYKIDKTRIINRIYKLDKDFEIICIYDKQKEICDKYNFNYKVFNKYVNSKKIYKGFYWIKEKDYENFIKLKHMAISC
jgi:group I intron endonuclease